MRANVDECILYLHVMHNQAIDWNLKARCSAMLIPTSITGKPPTRATLYKPLLPATHPVAQHYRYGEDDGTWKVTKGTQPYADAGSGGAKA